MSRYHVILQTCRIACGQTKYSGHTCLYTHDNGRVFDRSPSTVTELDVIVIRPKAPAGAAASTDFSRRPESHVKHSLLLAHLFALRHFYPDH